MGKVEFGFEEKAEGGMPALPIFSSATTEQSERAEQGGSFFSALFLAQNEDFLMTSLPTYFGMMQSYSNRVGRGSIAYRFMCPRPTNFLDTN